ncbi:unnamed protein product [Withania somnifera]
MQSLQASALQSLFWWKNLSYEPYNLSRKQDFIPAMTLPLLGPQRLSVQCGVGFRPCIDIHKGKAKQIVGSTLRDSKEADTSLVTNFESDKLAAEYAKLYRDDGLVGGHVIMLDPLSIAATTEALYAYPGRVANWRGIKTKNALSYIDEGASHAIITSYVFNNGQMDLERVQALASLEGEYVIVTDRWQKFSDLHLNEKVLNFLAEYPDEFLVQGVDVEGKKLVLDEELVAMLGKYSPRGNGACGRDGGRSYGYFRGNLAYKDFMAWHALQEFLAV